MYRLMSGAVVAGAFVLGLSACSNDDSPSGGQMKLAVADAPVDGAEHVVVEFTGVELTGDNTVNIDFSAPRTIDLITQSGTASAVLFDTPVPAGSYGQIRLKVVADGTDGHSYIDLSDGSRHPLRVPSGSETGLKLVSGFTVPESGVADYTVDFDLRKAITCPPGQSPACILKPALRLVNNGSVGNIQGIVDGTLTIPEDCAPAVYLYGAANATPNDNFSGAPATDTNQPIASKVPVATEQGLYYQFTFLAPGSYTVAYTCDAAADDPDQDDTVNFAPIVPNVTVTAGQTTQVDLAPPP